jgi:citrate lyase subunit beta/citryl-CoA lyase
MMRGDLVPYHRRGEMSIPAFRNPAGGDPETDGRAASLRMMGKAATLPVDFFFFDLEDAAPDNPQYKPLARRFAVEALNGHDFGDRVRAFRPNNLRTPWFEDDVVEVVGAAGDNLDVVVLPKTETFEEVADVQAILRAVQKAAGRSRRIHIEVLIESPGAFVDAERIASIEDVSALIFGAWDFARTLGAEVDEDRWLSDQAVARQTLPILAAAHGKDAVDAVTATLPIRPKDPTDVAAAARHADALALAARDAHDARRLGFAAKWILHPDQIEPIQGAFTPSRGAALAALDLAARYARAAASGSGAELDGGRLADKAVVGERWWQVEAGRRAGVISDEDLQATGLTWTELLSASRTADR